MRRLLPFTVAAVIVLFAGLMTWTIVRGEDTRRDVRRVETTVDPCKRPESVSCQRRIRLVLRELVRRHPRALRKLGLGLRDAGSVTRSAVGGGGAVSDSPSGGGPVGRVPPRRPPSPSPSPLGSPPSDPSEPVVNLDAPLVPRVCVGDLLAVNCR